MADKVNPSHGLPVDAIRPGERRDFIRRAGAVGLPVVLASVASRTVWANTEGSAGASVSPSADAGAIDIEPF